MPPFISAQCPHCGKPNRFDREELLKCPGEVYRGATPTLAEETHEVAVHCQHCHRPFKVRVPMERRSL